MAERACWNCRGVLTQGKDRKIGCDRTLPSCQNCTRRKKACSGYGLRLSWPHEEDRRRSIRTQNVKFEGLTSSKIEFVNATSWDVDLFVELTNTGTYVKHINSWPPIIPPSLPFTLSNVTMMDPSASETNSSAIARLLTSGEDREFELYKLLVRMALSDNTLPSLAIRFAISALAILHIKRFSEASRFQINALSALSRSINQQIGTEEGLKTIAASMLLNIYEIASGRASSMSWTIFFCGCKRISKMVYGHDQGYEGDLAMLLDWVFYHDVLYKFSIRHWTQSVEDQRQLAKERKMISKQIYSPLRSIILSSLGCSLELLDTLTLVIDNVLDRDDPLYLSEGHQQSTRSLELRLENMPQECRIGDIAETLLERDRSSGMAELYRLSTLIYLERVARGASKGSLKVNKWIVDSFKILETLQICERPFPLFVIAVEACTDYQRAIILKVIAGTMEERPLGAISSLKRMIEAAWVQDDLNLDHELDSLLKYNTLISANCTPSAFT